MVSDCFSLGVREHDAIKAELVAKMKKGTNAFMASNDA
jgi:hypothetical protein